MRKQAKNLAAGERRPTLMWPFAALNTRYRIVTAADHTVGAGVLLALAHFYTAPYVAAAKYAPQATLIGSDRPLLASIHVIAGLVALLLAALSRRHPSVGVAALLTIWAVLEAVPWIPFAIYGHAIFALGGLYQLGLLYYAVVGLRGALALKNLPLYPSPPRGPLQLDRP